MKNILNLFKSSNQIVAEIHSEVDSAQDRLLKEAYTLLESIPVNNAAQISRRLKVLGFENSSNVVESDKVSAEKQSALDRAGMISYYKQSYPFLKFLTEDELDRICKKYDLIYMPVQNYIGEVPEKNLIEIENSQSIKQVDLPEDKTWTDVIYYSYNYKNGWPLTIPGNITDRWDAERYIRTINKDASNNINGVRTFREKRGGLFICAPKSKFKGKSKAITFTESKDPIVFRYVRGGVQVLTKWGIEGRDESLVVDKLN